MRVYVCLPSLPPTSCKESLPRLFALFPRALLLQKVATTPRLQVDAALPQKLIHFELAVANAKQYGHEKQGRSAEP